MKKFSWLRRDRAPVALLTMFVLGACSNDVPQQIIESPRTSVFTQGDPEREALRRLARGIAIGLGDSEFRKGVKSSMQKALFKEHKLELRKKPVCALKSKPAFAPNSKPDSAKRKNVRPRPKRKLVLPRRLGLGLK